MKMLHMCVSVPGSDVYSVGRPVNRDILYNKFRIKTPPNFREHVCAIRFLFIEETSTVCDCTRIKHIKYEKKNRWGELLSSHTQTLPHESDYYGWMIGNLNVFT